MKHYYEMKQYRGRFMVLTTIFMVVLWSVSWYFCDFNMGKAWTVVFIATVFVLLVYNLVYQMLRGVYADVETISGWMLDVIDGKEKDTKEVYKQGVMGLLYTNYFKMVTALKESRQKEGREKEFLRDTISDISHQLKTPLASLKVFIDLLYEEKLKEESKRKEVLREAGKQLERMEWMVLAMLKLARIEAGSVRFERKWCEAEQILKTAIESVDYLYAKRKQKIVIHWPEGVEEKVCLNCDGEWLTEGLINLLKNASDYSGEDTIVSVKVEENNLFTRIYIKDEGVGIPEEALPHIFKRFYRVDNKINPGSVGIGLSLAKSIVEGMGGKLVVKSEVGKYTCFILTFMK